MHDSFRKRGSEQADSRTPSERALPEATEAPNVLRAERRVEARAARSHTNAERAECRKTGRGSRCDKPEDTTTTGAAGRQAEESSQSKKTEVETPQGARRLP